MGPAPGLGSLGLLGPLCQLFLRAECFGTARIDIQWLINRPVRGSVGRPSMKQNLAVQHPELHNLQRGNVTNPEKRTQNVPNLMVTDRTRPYLLWE